MKKNYNLDKVSKLFLAFMMLFAWSSMASAQITLVMGSSPATCEISSDGTAYVESQTGGVEPLTYAWADGQDFVVAYDLPAGDYTVTVTDANGVTATGTATVELSPESVWLMPVVTGAECDCSGTIDPMAMLGLPPYSYEWSDGQTAAIATGLCAGTYTVTVTDSQGCANSATAVVAEGEDCSEECTVTAGTASTEDETTICIGDGNPDPITVSIDGATEGADTKWIITDEMGLILATPPGPTFDLEGAVPGVCNIYYMVSTGVVTGADIGENIDAIEGCHSLSNAITVTRYQAPTPATLTPNGSVDVCVGDGEDDLIDVTAEGATGDESSWVITDENGNILELPAETPFNFEGAPEGVCVIYHVVWTGTIDGLEVGSNVADLTGCYAISEGINVVRNSLDVSLEEQQITSCKEADGALTVVGAGPDATYEWSNGATSASIDGLSEGEYSVTVTKGACVVEMTTNLYDDAVDIGDYVWYDNNENCRQDSYESGVPFVPVYLYSVGPDGLACTDDDVLEQTTGTDNTGYYLFECVYEGTYYVQFHATAVEPDYEYTCMDGADDAMDSDADPETGKTEAFDVDDITVDILTIDAGINPICNDVNYGGMICCDQTICAGEIPELLTSAAPAGGGGANDIEYLWMCANTPSNPGDPSTWAPIPNSNSADLQPGPVYQTKYFVRCARRGDCDDFNAESNTVQIRVVSCFQMQDFTVEAVSTKQVDLTWSIDGDSEGITYLIERSFDGVNFDVIAQVEGQNIQNEVVSYTYADVSPKVGQSVYRIKQIMENGNYHYSQPKDLLIRLADTQHFNIFPNPAQDVLKIENIETFEAQVLVDFMTPEGKVIQSTTFPEGTFKQEQINLQGLPSGTYFVRIIYTNKDVELLKVSKLID